MKYKSYLEKIHNHSDLFLLWLGITVAFTLVWWPLLNSICCILLFCFWLFFLQKRLQNHFRLFMILLFISVYIVAVAGVFNSQNKAEAFFTLQVKLPLLIFPVVLGTTNYMPEGFYTKTFQSFSVAFILFCTACIGKALYLYYQTGTTDLSFGYDILVLKHMYPSAVSLFCVFVISGHVINVYNKKARHYDFAALTISFILLFLTGNRMGLLLSTVIVLFIIVAAVKNLKQKIVFGLSFLMIILLVFWVNKNFRNKVQKAFSFSSGESIPLDTDASLGRSWDGKAIRIAIWKCSAEIMKSNFFTGVGTGDVQDELQKTYERRKFYFASRYNRYDAHNQYLQQWIMNGISGFLFFITIIVTPLFYKPFRSNRYYVLFLIIFGIFCITESMLEINKGIVWYSFFNSIFAFSDNDKPTPL